MGAPEARGAWSAISGEAVVLEVAPGKYLIAVLRGTPMAYRVFFPDEAPLEVAVRLETLRESRELNSKQYPTLVTFTDINDPRTVKQVDPANLSASFGPGFSVNSFNITVTDEAITEG